jgi:anti-anti-sigma factor
MAEVVHDGDAIDVKLDKDIVSTTVAAIKAELMDLVGFKPAELRLNLAGVQLVDSMGIGLLVATHNSLKKNGGALKLVQVPAPIAKLLRSMRLDRHFTVEE